LKTVGLGDTCKVTVMTIRYDTKEQFNVDSKAEYQFNHVAHV